MYFWILATIEMNTNLIFIFSYGYWCPPRFPYPFGILWPLYCLSYDLRILIAPLVSCGHCIVCPMIYGFWLPLWYLVSIVLSVLWFTDSDCPFGILWPLYYLFYDLRILIATLVSSNFSCNWPENGILL
jgi:hypothetical protein